MLLGPMYGLHLGPSAVLDVQVLNVLDGLLILAHFVFLNRSCVSAGGAPTRHHGFLSARISMGESVRALTLQSGGSEDCVTRRLGVCEICH